MNNIIEVQNIMVQTRTCNPIYNFLQIKIQSNFFKLAKNCLVM